jgi:hypothetical protein
LFHSMLHIAHILARKRMASLVKMPQGGAK